MPEKKPILLEYGRSESLGHRLLRGFTNQRQWEIETAPAQVRIVNIEHQWLTDQIVIWVDGTEIFRRHGWVWGLGGLWEGFEHRFPVDDRKCLLRIRTLFTHYEYELWLDGRLQ